MKALKTALCLTLLYAATALYGQDRAASSSDRAASSSDRAASSSDLDPATRARIDAEARRIVAQTGVPSAEVGIVRGGRVVYAAAFGQARLDPATPATPAMHYPVGSITKQFTASCILLLQQQGKLKLDDPVSNWFPEFTRSHDVTLRMLLTHTSGYSDFGTEDYTIPIWTKPTTPIHTVDEWAEKPLDFEPGTRWQYSNTNFLIAGLIVEKASGMPYMRFLRQNILDPLHLTGVLNLDLDRGSIEAQGYMRNALGPPRPAQLEAPGWYTGAGSLAMPVTTLLQWEISLLNRSLLAPDSYREMFTEQRLKDGGPTGYGLGIQVSHRNNRLTLSHGGEVGGFVAQETLFPNDNLAIAVLTNQEASHAAEDIANAVAGTLLPPATAAAPATLSPTTLQARAVLENLARGQIDRSQFADNANFYFNQQALDDFRDSLTPLGPLTDFKEVQSGQRGGMTMRIYTATYSSKSGTIISYWMPDGKIEQFLFDGN